MMIHKAIYKDQILPEYTDNPLISALPEKVNDEKVVELLTHYPEYDSKVREMDAFVRVEYLSRLETLVQPFFEYLTAFRSIENALKQSYSKRNPFSPSTVSYLHYTNYSELPTQPSSGLFNPSGKSITITGISGIGKSKMLNRILGCYPQVIQHSCFNGSDLELKQIVWIKVDCSHDATLSSLCGSILDSISSCTGVKHKPDTTISKMQDQIDHLLRSNFVGILVIDEMQNIKLAKAGGSDKFLAFILRLINSSGIVTIFCGNPELKEILSKEYRNARRAESGGYIDVKPLQGDMWEIFTEELWRLQWTSKTTPLTHKLSQKLHELSSGNIDIAIRTYEKVQRNLIGSNNEEITEEALVIAYDEACQLTKAATTGIGDPFSLELLKKKEKKKNENRSDIKQRASNKSKIAFNECHHPEFSEAISELIYSPILSHKIDDLDYVQRTLNDIDTDNKSALILSDPFKHFGEN